MKLGRLQLLIHQSDPAPPPARVPARLTPAERDGDSVVFSIVAGDQSIRMTIGRDDAYHHALTVMQAIESIDDVPPVEITNEAADERTADLEAMLAESNARMGRSLTEAPLCSPSV